MIRELIVDGQAKARWCSRMHLAIKPDMVFVSERCKAEEAPPSAGHPPAWTRPASAGQASAERGLNLERNLELHVLNSTASSDGSG
jgi:hypothetical protein